MSSRRRTYSKDKPYLTTYSMSPLREHNLNVSPPNKELNTDNSMFSGNNQGISYNDGATILFRQLIGTFDSENYLARINGTIKPNNLIEGTDYKLLSLSYEGSDLYDYSCIAYLSDGTYITGRHNELSSRLVNEGYVVNHHSGARVNDMSYNPSGSGNGKIYCQNGTVYYLFYTGLQANELMTLHVGGSLGGYFTTVNGRVSYQYDPLAIKILIDFSNY